MAYGGFINGRARFSLSMEMSRLARDGTAEPVSRGQIFGHARGQGNIHFSVQLTTSRIGLTRLIHTLLYVMAIHTYTHTYPQTARSEKNKQTRDASTDLGATQRSRSVSRPYKDSFGSSTINRSKGVASQNSTLPCAMTSFSESLLLFSPGDV